MIEIRKALVLDSLDYHETHLSLINCILPVKMTPMEIKVVAAFMSLEGDIAIYRFGPSANKIVMKQLGISPAGLSNYKKSLTNNGFLVQEGDLISILPLLVPEEDQQFYKIRLTNRNKYGQRSSIHTDTEGAENGRHKQEINNTAIREEETRTAQSNSTS